MPKSHEFSSILLKTQLFRGVHENELSTWFENKPYRILTFEKGMFLAHSGEPCNELIVLLSGTVMGEMHDFSGKSLKIEDMKAPKPLASAFLFGSDNRFPVSIIANSEATAMFIPRDVVMYLMQKSPVILRNFLNGISNRAQFLSSRIRFLTLPTIRKKIAHFLLGASGFCSDTIRPGQSLAGLAGYFGVARPSLSRSLSEMEAEGMISQKRGEIRITDREKLNKLLQE